MMLTKTQIVEMLTTNDRAVMRALVVLNARQTNDEQASQQTKNRNGRGFRPCHARMGTSMAQFFQRRGFLTVKQIAYWRMKDKNGKMRIEIYAGQLLEVAEDKAAMAAQKAQASAVEVVAPTLDSNNPEREMHRMEALNDAEETRRDELAKFLARCKMERRALRG